MITRFAMTTSRWVFSLAITLTLAACGGGGGGGGGSKDDDGFLSNGGGSGSGDTYFLSLTLVDEDGEPTNTISGTDPATARAVVTQNGANGKPVADVVVNFSADIGVLLPASATALTDEEGLATILLASDGVLGAGTLGASVDGPNGPVTAELTYQVDFSDVQLGHFQGDAFIPGEIGVRTATLGSGGSTLLTVSLVDSDGDVLDSTEEIAFSSRCSRSGNATIESPVETENGLATSTYTNLNCDGTDNIEALVKGTAIYATATIDLIGQTAGALSFVSADPLLIALKGTGGPNRQEDADVVFRVVDGNNQPVQGIEVDFGLSTSVGGIRLSPESAITDAEGLVTVAVQSGNVPTPVRVTASVSVADEAGNEINLSTLSDQLVITSGLPDQNSISLSQEKLSVSGALDTDGIPVVFTVRMADKFNNPVPDGTAATFTTEYGSIGGSCVTSDGSCSVTWVSQDPRPDWFSDGLIFADDYRCPSHNGASGPCPDDIRDNTENRSAVSSITVIAIGQEDFIDRNGNGLFDQDEAADGLFTDNLPEAFTDYNNDGVWTPNGTGDCPLPLSSATCSGAGIEEIFFDYNQNGVYDFNDDPAVYNGKLCPQEGDGIWCSRELVHVSDSAGLLLTPSGSGDFYFNLAEGGSLRSRVEEGGIYRVYISDIFNNPPVLGDTLNIETSGDCELVTKSSFDLVDTLRPGAYSLPLEVEGPGEESSTNLVRTGSVTITLETERGGKSEVSYSCMTRNEEGDAGGAGDGLAVGGG